MNNELMGKRVIILGEGISGKGAFNALKDIAYPFFYQQKKEPLCDSNKFCHNFDLVVTSPGIAAHPVFDYANKRGIEVISEIELGYRLSNSPIVAVTGTNGKTTVTSLIGKILSGKFSTLVSGNIGDSYAKSCQTPHDIAVLEVSSFQLERCYKFRPNIAVVTNIAPDHLDRHGSMEDYILAKKRIAKNMNEDDYLVITKSLEDVFEDCKASKIIVYEDENLENLIRASTSNNLSKNNDYAYQYATKFNINNSVYIKNRKIFFGKTEILSIDDIPLAGAHNVINVMQAAIVGMLLGVSKKSIISAVRGFKPAAHRLALVSSKLNKRWYDDSKGTNIGACLAACRYMEGDTALILGGSDKGYDYNLLFASLPEAITKVFIMGEVKDKLASAAASFNQEVTLVQNLSEAVALCANLPVKNVLLSPAAASFDCYKDYKHRGEDFLRLINLLKCD